MRQLWNSLCQPHLDYGSVLWYPSEQKSLLMKGEAPFRAFSKKAWGMRSLNYWQRLERFKLNSNQRRMERYRIIYVWKSLNGIVPNLGFEWNSEISNLRNGRVLKYPSINGVNASSKTL